MPTNRRYLVYLFLLFVFYYLFLRNEPSNQNEVIVVRFVENDLDEADDYTADIAQREPARVIHQTKELVNQKEQLELVPPQETVSPTATQTTPTPTEPVFVRKIVGIGDLHGDLPNAMKVLHMMNVIDERGDWSGEIDFLVQTGDIIGKHFARDAIYLSLTNMFDRSVRQTSCKLFTCLLMIYS